MVVSHLMVFNLQRFGCLIPLVMILTFSFMTFRTHSRVYIIWYTKYFTIISFLSYTIQRVIKHLFSRHKAIYYNISILQKIF
jgi:hypothetical protein